MFARLEDDDALWIGVADALAGGCVGTRDWSVVIFEIARAVALKMSDVIRSDELRRHAAIEENITLKGLAGSVASGKALM